MLARLFSIKAGPDVIETARVPAEEHQSADFVSYRAVRNWRGFYDVHFCDYLPLPTFSVRLSSQAKHLAKGEMLKPIDGVVHLKHPFIRNTTYKGVETRKIARNLTLPGVLEFLREKENGFNRDDAEKYVTEAHQNPHANHFQNFVVK